MLAVGVASVGAHAAENASAEVSPKARLARAHTGGGPQTLSAKMTMILSDKGGREVRRELEIRREGDDHQVLWFVSPADVRGTAFLRVNEDGERKMWLYLPAFDKLERIAGAKEHNSFLGSDFTYADLGARKLDQYTHRARGVEAVDGIGKVRVIVSEATAAYEGPNQKIVSYLDPEDDHLLGEDLYDKQGELRKQKRHLEIETFGGYKIPTVVEMTDVVRQHKTRITMDDVQVDEKLPSRLFRYRNLKRLE